MMIEETAETADKLKPKEQQLLTALMAQPTIAQAAEAAGISEATAYRYLKRPDFADAYRKTRQAALLQATARLSQLASEAVEALGQTINSPTAKTNERISAARIVLDFAYAAHDIEALSAAVDELKAEYE